MAWGGVGEVEGPLASLRGGHFVKAFWDLGQSLLSVLPVVQL